MRELTVIKTGPLDVPTPTAKVLCKGRDTFWVCDSWGELVEAMDEGRPFVAHRVEGLRAIPTLVNPAWVMTVDLDAEFVNT